MKNLAIIPSQGSATYFNLIAAGPLTKQPGSKAYRTVIVQYQDQSFSVHDECYKDEEVVDKIQNGDVGSPIAIPKFSGGQMAAVCHPSYLHQGNYFKSHQIVEATNCFAERLTRRSQYLESIYREEVTA